jgi:hypothetical protein
MKALARTIGIGMTLACTACTTLSRSEESELRELQSYGLRPSEETKSPALAGTLNVLPGFGNFYLAIGTDESSHWLYGFLNLLVWPASVLWGVPEAVIDANNINKKEMVDYYTFDPAGKAELAKVKDQRTATLTANQ